MAAGPKAMQRPLYGYAQLQSKVWSEPGVSKRLRFVLCLCIGHTGKTLLPHRAQIAMLTVKWPLDLQMPGARSTMEQEAHAAIVEI